jgi:nitrogen regulatory protein PII
MSKLVVLITSHIEKSLEVAEAWQAAGAPGVTLLDSHGLHRLQEKSRDLELPVFVSMASVLRQLETTSQIILSVVEDHNVETLIKATTDVLGDLYQPDTGIVFVMDVERVVGLSYHGRTKGTS